MGAGTRGAVGAAAEPWEAWRAGGASRPELHLVRRARPSAPDHAVTVCGALCGLMCGAAVCHGDHVPCSGAGFCVGRLRSVTVGSLRACVCLNSV